MFSLGLFEHIQHYFPERLSLVYASLVHPRWLRGCLNLWKYFYNFMYLLFTEKVHTSFAFQSLDLSLL